MKQLKAPVLTMTFRDSSTVYVKQVCAQIPNTLHLSCQTLTTKCCLTLRRGAAHCLQGRCAGCCTRTARLIVT